MRSGGTPAPAALAFVVIAAALNACSPSGDSADGTRGADGEAEQEQLEFSDICDGACMLWDVLDQAILDGCGCEEPCQPDGLALYVPPESETCAPLPDGCFTPEGWVRCQPCTAEGFDDVDDGTPVEPFAAFRASKYTPQREDFQCQCDGRTGELNCVAIEAQGCFDERGNLYPERGAHALIDDCRVCDCDGYAFDDTTCTTDACIPCTTDAGTLVDAGTWENNDALFQCYCQYDGTLDCVDVCPTPTGVLRVDKTRQDSGDCTACTCIAAGTVECVDVPDCVPA